MSVSYNKERKRWVFDFSKIIRGQRVRVTKTLPKGWGRAEAETYDRAETERLYGVATGTIKPPQLIETAVELYIKHQCPKLKTGGNVIKELALIYWCYAGKHLDELQDVARHYIANATDVKGQPLAPASIRNRLAYLRAACRYAQKHHGIGQGITFDIAMPKVRNERDVYATRAEMIKIARACPTRESRALVRIAFYTGMRIGEIFSGKNLTIKENVLKLADTKNDEIGVVPIHPKIKVLMKYIPFKFKKGWTARLVRRAMNEAGFPHMHFHDLRHSTASAMINSGVTLYEVGEVLRHKDKRSTQRYAHLYIETLTRSILKIR